MKRTDLMLGLYILVPIIFLIIPIPLFLLDILMMLNLQLHCLYCLMRCFRQRR